jgi:hypothetical protein
VLISLTLSHSISLSLSLSLSCAFSRCHRSEEIKQEFETRYPTIRVVVDCPKPIIVTELIKGPNNGFAFVRFADRRDRDKALKDVQNGNFQFHGKTVTGKDIIPSFWPRESTRRYY